MNKRLFIIIIISVLLGITAGAAYVSIPKKNPRVDALAKCLSTEEVVMYGAYWCPHCQRQKKLFGDAFQYINYVECTDDVKACEEKKIKGYPTWIFKDGSRIEGEATFSELSQKTACTYGE